MGGLRFQRICANRPGYRNIHKFQTTDAVCSPGGRRFYLGLNSKLLTYPQGKLGYLATPNLRRKMIQR